MQPVQTAHKDQSDLGPYYLQYRQPKNVSRGKEQATKFVTGGKLVKILEQCHEKPCLCHLWI